MATCLMNLGTWRHLYLNHHLAFIDVLSVKAIPCFCLLTLDSLALIVRASEGLLRRTRNICLASLIEAVRDQTRAVDLKHVNKVLMQPHWRKDYVSTGSLRRLSFAQNTFN